MNALRLGLPGLLLGLAFAGLAPAGERDGVQPLRTTVVGANPDSIGQYGFKTTSNNLLNVTITNSGGWGVGYTSSVVPNFSYPAGLTFEHMVRGGLWIGAKTLDGTPVVSFGAVDQNGGISAPQTEFTPLPNTASTRLVERSILTNSPRFSRQAVSEQDYVAYFRDFPGGIVNSEAHVPMYVSVREEVYSWSFAFAENFVIQHFVIKNEGDAILRDMYVTHYTEMQSLNKQTYPNYPNQLNPAPYNKKLMDWYPELRLVTEHYCDSPRDCHFERVPYIAGVMMLGTRPDTIVNFHPKVLTRKYSGSGFDVDTPYARATDAQKYEFQQLPEEVEEQAAGSSDPSQWLTIGPIPVMNPGDSIVVDFAYVAGATPEDIQLAARHAQLAFDLNYNLPTPPPSPRLYARPVEQGIELLWEGSPDTTLDTTGPPGTERDFEGYRVYKGESINTLKQVGEFDLADTVGFNTGLEAIRLPADSAVVFTAYTPEGVAFPDTMRYHTFVRGLRDGFKYYFAVTSFDQGNPRIESLESGKTQNRLLAVPGPDIAQAAGQAVTVFPNPYRVEARWDFAGTSVRDHYLWFVNLPSRCKLRVYTLGGDLVHEVNFDAATYHGVNAHGLFAPGTTVGLAPPTLSGSAYAWDLISNFNQAVGSGMYIFSVEEPNGKRQVGKFVILKSDREG